MDEDNFERIVRYALKDLPVEFSEKIKNIAVLIADVPSPTQYRKIFERGGGLLLGLYEGIPQTKRRNYGIGPTLPDKITIFRYPILYLTQGDETKIRNLIIDTVKHEIAHHFGMSDEEISKAKNK